MTREERSLKIGYIWQSVTADKSLNSVTATALHIRSVIEAFQERGHQVRIISFLNGEPHWSDDGVSWQRILPRKRMFVLRVIESLPRGVQRRLNLPYFNIFDSYRFSDACVAAASNFDVLYERFWILASGGLIASKRIGIPIVYEVNGDITEEYQGHKLPRSHWSAIHFVTRRMFKHAGKVITVNDTLMQRLITRYKLRPAQVCTIDNGARVDKFFKVDKDKSNVLVSKYQLAGKISIIFVGTFKPWHGLDMLINAFHALATHNQKVRLIMVGSGPLLPDIKKHVEKLRLNEKVVFTDMVHPDEVPNLLDVADIAVLNPKVSGASTAQSPLKLFEYMAAGKAIVAPRIDYVEKILIDRESALLITPDDVDALKCSLLELVENQSLRQQLGESAQRKALQEHSWNNVARKIEDIMYSLIDGSLSGKVL